MSGVCPCRRWLAVALISVSALYLSACSSRPSAEEGGPEADVLRSPAAGALQLPDYVKKALSESAAEENPLTFYGIVLDQRDQPVVGAKVKCVVSATAFPIKPRDVTFSTDKEGRFEVVNGRGTGTRNASQFWIIGVEAEGYEYSAVANLNNDFNFWGNDKEIHHADPKSPVVFRARKMRANPTFMFEESKDLDVDENSIWWVDLSGISYGLARCTARDASAKPPKNTLGAPGWWDFVVEYRLEGEGKTVALVFRALEEDGGFVAGAELLTDAPESGYEREFVLRFPTGSPGGGAADPRGKIYLYSKTRKPSVYSLIILKDAGRRRVPTYVPGRSGQAAHIRLELNTRMNPYGDRNLEMLLSKSGRNPDNSFRPSVEGKMRLRLEDAAAQSLSEGVLPRRPDMKKLAEEVRRDMERGQSRPATW